MRASELADLAADAVVQVGAGHWLRIPLGKLRNDRYVPLHPDLVTLLAAWTAANLEHIRRHKRLVADHRGPLDRHVMYVAELRARGLKVPGDPVLEAVADRITGNPLPAIRLAGESLARMG